MKTITAIINDQIKTLYIVDKISIAERLYEDKADANNLEYVLQHLDRGRRVFVEGNTTNSVGKFYTEKELKSVGCIVKHKHTGVAAICDTKMIHDFEWLYEGPSEANKNKVREDEIKSLTRKIKTVVDLLAEIAETQNVTIDTLIGEHSMIRTLLERKLNG